MFSFLSPCNLLIIHFVIRLLRVRGVRGGTGGNRVLVLTTINDPKARFPCQFRGGSTERVASIPGRAGDRPSCSISPLFLSCLARSTLPRARSFYFHGRGKEPRGGRRRRLRLRASVGQRRHFDTSGERERKGFPYDHCRRAGRAGGGAYVHAYSLSSTSRRLPRSREARVRACATCPYRGRDRGSRAGRPTTVQ